MGSRPALPWPKPMHIFIDMMPIRVHTDFTMNLVKPKRIHQFYTMNFDHGWSQICVQPNLHHEPNRNEAKACPIRNYTMNL
jgi:hypothetical protein